MKSIGLILVCILAALALYVRFAPSDPKRWHVAVPEVEKDLVGGAIVIISGNTTIFARLGEIAASTPRTQLLAGSVGEGQMTFVTRSRWWGFPDYTTLALQGGMITLFARLRFGRSDMGVNRARVQNWLKRAQLVQN